MSIEEQKRLPLVTEVDAGRTTASEAAALLGMSTRQFRRLLAAFRKEGAAGLAHGNRGRASGHKTLAEVCQTAWELAHGEYSDYNDTHFTEKLAEAHGIKLSRSTVRRLRRAIGQGSPRRRRVPHHRKRRERYPQAGMLLQIDGSPHDWLEGRGPHLVLIAAIDDATGQVPHALFREEEDAAGYFELMQEISRSHGLPQAVYSDRHTIFQSPKKATLQQKLAGELPRSQFGRLMDELAVELIEALSPQAKGRVERLFQTLQDRLVKELREANASTREEANQVLSTYLPRFNVHFGVEPAQDASAYRAWPADLRPEEVFCFKHQRTVNNDNTISFDGHRLQIPPSADRPSYARAHVEVQQRLDGSLAICYQGRTLVTYQSAKPGPVRVGEFTPLEQTETVAQNLPEEKPTPAAKSRQPYKPPANHPWRRPYAAKPK